jgi:hypothetical protein
MSFEVDVRIDDKHRSFMMRAPKDSSVSTVLQHLLNDVFKVPAERVVIGEEYPAYSYFNTDCIVLRHSPDKYEELRPTIQIDVARDKRLYILSLGEVYNKWRMSRNVVNW